MNYLEKNWKIQKLFEDLKTVKHKKITKVLNDYNKVIFRNRKKLSQKIRKM